MNLSLSSSLCSQHMQPRPPWEKATHPIWSVRALDHMSHNFETRGSNLALAQLPRPFHSTPRTETLELLSGCPSSPRIGIPPCPEDTASHAALSGCPMCYPFLLLPDLLSARNAHSSTRSWDCSLYAHSLNNLSQLPSFGILLFVYL